MPVLFPLARFNKVKRAEMTYGIAAGWVPHDTRDQVVDYITDGQGGSTPIVTMNVSVL